MNANATTTSGRCHCSTFRRKTIVTLLLVVVLLVFLFRWKEEEETVTKRRPDESLHSVGTGTTTTPTRTTATATTPTKTPRKKIEILGNEWWNDTAQSSAAVCGRRAPPQNVLALGGSVTWGASLEDNRAVHGYPALLAANATNLAIRATGPEIPAVCVQSMLQHVGLQDVEYDLITLEFSLNGIACLEPLLQRLRRRYPQAILIYVEVWSFFQVVVDKKTKKRPPWLLPRRTPPTDLEEDSLEYSWPQNGSYNVTEHTQQMVEAVGGALYRMPVPENPKTALDEKWFDDLFHLGVRGHEIAAEGILQTYCETLDQKHLSAVTEEEDSNYPRDGTWGFGDECFVWFMGDEPSPQRLAVEGASLVEFEKGKFAYQVPTPKGNDKDERVIFRLEREFDKAYKLGITHMTKSNWYPRTNVTIQVADNQQDDDDDDDKKSISLLNPRGSDGYHISRLQMVGHVVPHQANIVSLQPIETTSQPFRITALMVCPDCSQLHEGELQCPMFESSEGSIVYNLTSWG